MSDRHITYSRGIFITDEANDGNGAVALLTPAGHIDALMDQMFVETLADGHSGVWSSAEWRAAITKIAEDVPALKLVLADGEEGWTNDQWADAVISVRDGLLKEDAGE